MRVGTRYDVCEPCSNNLNIYGVERFGCSSQIVFSSLHKHQCLEPNTYGYERSSSATLPAGMSATSPFSSRSLVRLLSASAILMPVSKQRFYSTTVAATAFTYRLGVAASGKQIPPRPPKINRDFWNYASTGSSAVAYLSSTKPDSGEDAFFATRIGGSPNAVAFGLADGVGGWQDQGVDPSKYSHGLCKVMVETAAEQHAGTLPKPRDLLQIAYEAVTKDPRIPAGGCTASLAVADEQGHLEAAK